MSTIDVLCIDLGASNGRGIIGAFDGTILTLNEAHRFVNGPVSIFSHLYWDIFHLHKEMLTCIRAANISSSSLQSIGIDGWSQDYGLIDQHGQLMGMPRHYRDPRTDQIVDSAHLQMSANELFRWTGKTPTTISTLYQLLAMQRTERTTLEHCQTLLFIPNLLGYFLTGEKNCDVTLASASALYDVQARDWCDKILTTFDLPKILPDISKSGHTIGRLREDISHQAGITGKTNNIPLISVAQHDTISALITAHLYNPTHAVYISCGTWSIVGTTVPCPIVNEQARAGSFCNEPGYYQDLHFIVKYMTGLWILQECIREWEIRGVPFNYERIQQSAISSRFSSSIDVENHAFASPGQMLSKIFHHCKETKQQQPSNEVEFFICIMRGLALSYSRTIKGLQKLTGKTFNEIRVVGGGSRNAYLCQLTAQLTGIPVIAGPDEASVAGNALIQLISLGEISGITEAADIMQKSFQCNQYLPN